MHDPHNSQDPDEVAAETHPGPAEDAIAGTATTAGPARPPIPTPLPHGGRLLTADEAVDALVRGDHPDGVHGSVELDAALIEMLRDGQVVACRMPDERIAFSRAMAPDEPRAAP